MTALAAVRVGDVTAVLERRYPPAGAEDWDVVGLTVGTIDAAVHRISYTVDCTIEVVAEAVAAGADLIIAHHPLLLGGIRTLDLDQPAGRVVAALIRHGVALFVAHTNADVPPTGVADAMADRLGLADRKPIRPAPGVALDKLVTFVPSEFTDQVVDALATAGAGRVGNYDRCFFAVDGTGSFRPLPGATPFLGEPGRTETVAETRLEMVLARRDRAAVVTALHQAHPYEQPAYDVVEVAPLPSRDTGLGRVGTLAAPVTLGEFADRVAAVLGHPGGGIRVAGQPDRMVARVAVQAGSGQELLADVRQCGADVYVTSDLRHHPALDSHAWPDAPALIDVPHSAAESLWLPVVAREVERGLAERGLGVPAMVSSVCTDPWTWTIPAAVS